VVAEGVESEAVWSDLARLDCDLAQGYYLSRPIPGEALAAWVTERVDAVSRAPFDSVRRSGPPAFDPLHGVLKAADGST
jgi:predicted signal transduction protein with EAL and GGDEF domain